MTKFKMTRHSSLFCLIFLFLLSTLNTAHAADSVPGDLRDSFKRSFENAVMAAPPGTFRTGSRTIHSGGYVRVRFATKGPLNPIQIQSPSMSGGCNGFDLHGGSFSYVDTDEIIEWLRAVTENAGALATYMFMTYMKEMCPVCSEVMQMLDAMQNLINTTMGGSCEVATAMVSGVEGAITGEPSQEWEQYLSSISDSASSVGAAWGEFQDAASGKKEAEEDAYGAAMDAAGGDTEMAYRQMIGGNALRWIIEDAELVDQMEPVLGNGLTDELLHFYLTAMVGNYIQDLSSNNEGSETRIRAAVSLNSLLDDQVNSTEVQGLCNSWGGLCLDVDTVEFQDGYTEMDSFSAYFECQMTGTDVHGNDCGSVGLLNYLGQEHPDGGLSSDERTFISQFQASFPFMGMLRSLASSPGLMEGFYNCAADQIRTEFAYAQLMYPLQIVRDAVPVADMSSLVASAYSRMLDARLTELQQEYSQIEQEFDAGQCGVWSRYSDLINIRDNN